MAPTNIPLQLTNFIGRNRELAAVKNLLSSARLVTLTGVGGCGKTRLAIQVAKRTNQNYPDGVWFAGLAALREPDLILQFIVEVLGLHLVANQSLQEGVKDYLQSKRLLLILDNCEHMLAACAALTQQLLSFAPDIRILATSREPLAIAGEMIFPISGMDWPDIADNGRNGTQIRTNLQELMAYDAVQLFVQRARAFTPNFRLTSENADAVIEICRHLDGLPLALELASARTNVLTVWELAARLNDRFALLTSGQRAGFELRHQTLRATIDWSYALLTVEEQCLLNRLAVFNAGCTLDTAEAICAGEGLSQGQILDLLSSLVLKSLVVAETTGRAHARYRLLETIREYALHKLDEVDETALMRDRHLTLYLARVEEALPKQFEAYQQLWLNWLESEHDNMRSALTWALESRQIELGLRLASALTLFWEIRGYVREGVSWLERLLAEADEKVSLKVHVDALVFATFHYRLLGDGQAAIICARQAVELAEAVHDPDSAILAFARDGMASAARIVGDYQTAFDFIEQNIHFYRQAGPPYYLGMSLLAQGENATQLGYYKIARERLDESLALARQDGNSFRIAHTLNNLGDLARLEHKFAEAAENYTGALEMLRELDAERDQASLLSNLGFAFLHLGKVGRAYNLFLESAAILQAQQNDPGLIECLIGFAATAVAGGQPAAGARLFAAASALSKQPAVTNWKATQMEYVHYLSLAQKELPEVVFLKEQKAGQALTLEEAVALAQNLAIKEQAEPQIKGRGESLTPREGEVALLIAEGKTNQEIAEQLVLSKRTVEKHVANILSKLGFSRRSQIVRWAMEQSQPPVA